MTFILVLQRYGDAQYAKVCKSRAHALAYMECESADHPGIRQTIVEIDCPELADLPKEDESGK